VKESKASWREQENGSFEPLGEEQKNPQSLGWMKKGGELDGGAETLYQKAGRTNTQ